MENSNIEAPSYNPDLSKQNETDGESCSAHAAINVLELMGISVSQQDRNLEIEYAIKEKQLDVAERTKFFHKYGYSHHSLMMDLDFQKDRSANSIYQTVSGALEKTPIGFAIASKLSKRPEEFRTDRNVSHAVTAYKEGDKIFLIDPYDPDSKEIFDVSKEEEKFRFMTWFMSGMAQNIVVNTGDKVTNNSVLEMSAEYLKGNKVAYCPLPVFAIGGIIASDAYYAEPLLVTEK